MSKEILDEQQSEEACNMETEELQRSKGNFGDDDTDTINKTIDLYIKTDGLQFDMFTIEEELIAITGNFPDKNIHNKILKLRECRLNFQSKVVKQSVIKEEFLLDFMLHLSHHYNIDNEIDITKHSQIIEDYLKYMDV